MIKKASFGPDDVMPGRFAQAVHDGKPHLILTHPFSQDEIHAFAVKGAQVMEKRSGVSFKGGPSIMDDKIAALGEWSTVAFKAMTPVRRPWASAMMARRMRPKEASGPSTRSMGAVGA